MTGTIVHDLRLECQENLAIRFVVLEKASNNNMTRMDSGSFISSRRGAKLNPDNVRMIMNQLHLKHFVISTRKPVTTTSTDVEIVKNALNEHCDSQFIFIIYPYQISDLHEVRRCFFCCIPKGLLIKSMYIHYKQCVYTLYIYIYIYIYI